MTTTDFHARVSTLFLEARELPPEGREAFLKTASRTDPEVLIEVRSLLAHDLEAVGGAMTAAVPTPAEISGWSVNPNRIGPYRVIERIGRGGSGYVLLAEQDHPVRRRVAIKIVPHAAISPEAAARFDVERRALELTEHPNIARILDAGRTDDGLPYLVMDFVDGVTITEHCRTNNVRLHDRIELVLDVADAIQHAHQRGVIHRDLKPGNILVSEIDGRPVPRIVDFGIAKSIGTALGDDTPNTIGAALGTPAYMAPEQTGGRSIDTRADVYALGAVLYELTCGRTPIDANGDTVEVLQRIRTVIPAPAAQIRARNETQFGGDPVTRSVLTDLDCILSKALEKDPNRRYPTAAAFAADLRRLLAHEPIEARPPTRRYRAARFAQRNRALVVSLAVVAIAMMVGIAGLLGGLIEARRQKQEAANQFDAQLAVNVFLTDDLLAGAAPDQEGQNVTALDLLKRASRRVDQRFGDRPLIAASIHHTLGNTFMQMGEFDLADQHVQKALALRREVAGPNARETLHSEIAAGSLLVYRQQMPRAKEALTQAVKRARLVLNANDAVLYTALNNLGLVYEYEGNHAEGIPLLEEALAGRVRVLGPRDAQVLVTTSNLALAYDEAGKPEQSLDMLLESLRIAESLDDTSAMTLLGLSNNIGATYQGMNRDAEAAPYLRRAAELAKQHLSMNNPATLTIMANLAALEAELGDADRALSLYQEIIATQTALIGAAAPDTLTSRYGYCNALWQAKRFEDAVNAYTALLPDSVATHSEKHWLTAQIHVSLARALLDAGRPAEALPHAEQGLTQFRAVFDDPNHTRTRSAIELEAKLRENLAENTAISP